MLIRSFWGIGYVLFVCLRSPNIGIIRHACGAVHRGQYTLFLMPTHLPPLHEGPMPRPPSHSPRAARSRTTPRSAETPSPLRTVLPPPLTASASAMSRCTHCWRCRWTRRRCRCGDRGAWMCGYVDVWMCGAHAFPQPFWTPPDDVGGNVCTWGDIGCSLDAATALGVHLLPLWRTVSDCGPYLHPSLPSCRQRVGMPSVSPSSFYSAPRAAFPPSSLSYRVLRAAASPPPPPSSSSYPMRMAASLNSPLLLSLPRAQV